MGGADQIKNGQASLLPFSFVLYYLTMSARFQISIADTVSGAFRISAFSAKTFSFVMKRK